ncbi:hypothetical protein CVU37_03990 [candidate division BRC1 bacterium HGW-BRC1-1]|nr:MAG: hypothetical protein CVU37_03990 [candidate division BRC1 bacterium HGW-BRC1-1]
MINHQIKSALTLLTLTSALWAAMPVQTGHAQDAVTTVSVADTSFSSPEIMNGLNNKGVEETLTAPAPEPYTITPSDTTSETTELPADFANILPKDLRSPDTDLLGATTSTQETRYFDLPASPLNEAERDAMTSTAANAVRLNLLPAVFRALEMNQSLKISKISPEVSNTSIDSALSEFDPTVRTGVNTGARESGSLSARANNTPKGDRDPRESNSRSTDLNASIGGRLPTGTDYTLGFAGGRSDTNRTHPFYDAALNLNITQNLLRGAGCEVNYIRVWTAQNNFVISLYQLQQVTIDLVTNVQNSYYDLYLAARSLDISLNAHDIARQQRLRTEEFARVGRVPSLDVLAAQAEESSRISEVINSAETLRRRQLDLLRLLNPDFFPLGWKTRLFAQHGPILPNEKVDPDDRVKVALKWRPDLRQAQIDLANNELEVVRSENGLLPVLDFVLNAGLNGLGDSPGQALKYIGGTDFPNYNVGLQFSYPLQNRAAKASHRRATFQRQQAVEALTNFQQIIEFDVRAAAIEIERTRKLIDSTKITASLRIEELRAEMEKYRVGRSTQLLVNQAQRDTINAALNQVSAEVAHMKAYIALYRVEGTTLQRAGISPIMITPESGVGIAR